jgi:hypothetical protein
MPYTPLSPPVKRTLTNVKRDSLCKDYESEQAMGSNQ